MNQEIASVEKELEKVRQKSSELENKKPKNPILRSDKAEAEKIENELGALGEKAVELEDRLEALNKTRAEFLTQHGLDEGMGSVEASERLKLMGKEAEEAFNNMSVGANKSGGFIQKLTKRIGKLAIRVFIFSQITKAFRSMVSAMQEGFKNLAQYSKEYNGVMSDFKSQTETLKNSLATAFAPIMTTIIPYLTKLVSWLVTASNYIAEFWAVLSGKGTFAKAKQQMIDYKKTVGGAVAETNKLASFDDLNVLDSDQGGGGGGGAVTGANAFEEMEVDKSKFEWVDWLKENFDTILEVASLIGIALLAWKISSALGAGLATTLGIMLTLVGVCGAVYKAIDMWNNGITDKSLLEYCGFLVIALTGLGLLFGTVGVAIGLLVGGLALVAIGFHELIKTGELTDGAFKAIELGILAIGIAFTLLLGPIALVPMAIAMLVVAVIKYKDEIVDAIQKGWKYIKEHCSKAWESLKEGFKNFGDFITRIWTALKESVVGIVTALWNKVKEVFGTLRDNISSIVTKLWENIKETWNNIKKSVVDATTNMWSSVKEKFTTSVSNLKESLNKFKDFWKKIWDGLKNTATSIVSNMWNGLKRYLIPSSEELKR